MDEIKLDEKEEPVFKAITVWLPQAPFLAIEDLRAICGERNVARWMRRIVTREIEKEKRRTRELADVG